MRRWLWRIAKLVVALVILLGVSGVLIVRSEWFRLYLQRRVVEIAERATGARVELGRLSVDWQRLTARVDQLVLHGTEPAGEPPFLRVDSATLGLKVISVFEQKVDLQSLRVERPQVRILTNPDGSTNIPGPESRRSGDWTDPFLNLAIGSYEVDDGVMEYDNQRTPFHLRGESLRIRMTYDAQGPAYKGELSSDGVRIVPPGSQPLDTKVSTQFRLERGRVALTQLRVATADTSADLEGTLENLRTPHGTFTVKATSAVREAVRIFSLPIAPAGTATFDGQLTVSFEEGFDYSLQGRLAARGLNYTYNRIRIEGARLTATADASPSGLHVRGMTLQAMDANVTGELSLDQWRQLSVDGNVQGLDMQRSANMVLPRPVPWNGTLAGTFHAALTLRQSDVIAQANLDISPLPPSPGAVVPPLEGHLAVTYDQAAGTLELGSSSLVTPATRLEFSGALGRTLRVQMRSTDLDDLLPALSVLREDAPQMFPLKLNNGSITLDGMVQGSLSEPHFQGQVAIVNGQVSDYPFERFSAELDATERQILARNIRAARTGTELTGSAALTARSGADGGGFTNAEMTGQLDLRNVPVGEIVRQLGGTMEVAGTAAAEVRISGSVQLPEADITLDVANPEALGEKLDRIRADLRYLPGELRVTNGVATDGPSQIRFNGRYAHPPTDYRSGDVTFEAVSENLPSGRLERVARIRPAVAAMFSGRVSGTGRLERGAFSLRTATADLSARDIRVEGEDIGNLKVTAETRGTQLTMNAGGNIRESAVEVSGSWALDGEQPGTATLKFSRLGVGTLHELSMIGDSPEEHRDDLQVEGYIEGGATIAVPLKRLQAFQSTVTLNVLQLNPRPGQTFGLNVQPQDLILRNSQPVVIDLSSNGARVRAAELRGRNTAMTIAGVVPFQETEPINLSVRGNINLIILQLLNPGLLAQGNATVDASITRSLRNPDVNGRLNLSGASLYLKDFPNGLDNTSGTIQFDRNRATIGRLTADISGGRVAFTGFLGFGNALVYRLQAEARQIRVRYPQDVSSTFDANLALNGTSSASTLSGVVTLNRATISQRADLGQLLAQASGPALAATTPNEFLSSVQLDLRVASNPNFQLESPLTSNVEVDVDLRLRGSPERPVLAGNITVNRGEMQVFGNRYTIDRGEIRFLNPVRIEPSFDIDLTTRARGVTVNVSFSGTIQKLNVNYSSDPPLQQSEIIALLAVGRDPTSTANQLAPGVGSNGASSFVETGGGLLGQAATQQVSNRLQRFFGATRVKIDPTLTGVDNLPQARLTFEQQVSKDITLTYITNLNRTTEQVVRFQWDLSSEWSAIAVRDQNGLFGVDFQFRKRF